MTDQFRNVTLLEMMGVVDPPPASPVAPIVRPKDDHYRTPPECLRALASVVNLSAGMHEFCAGDGILGAVAADLIGAGNVTATTIEPPAKTYCPVERLDFLTLDRLVRPNLVTNTPYGFLYGRKLGRARAAARLIAHALDLLERAGDGMLCCLLDLRFSLSEERNRPGGLLYERPPAVIEAFQDRVTMYPGGVSGTDDEPLSVGAMPFAWFIWEPPFRRPGFDPRLRRRLNSSLFRDPADLARFDLPVVKSRRKEKGEEDAAAA